MSPTLPDKLSVSEPARRPPLAAAVVVPTLGASPYLLACLEALRADGGAALTLLLVAPAELGLELPAGLVDRRLEAPAEAGFAAAVNRGLAACDQELVGTVNDDVLVEPGWLGALAAALTADPRCGAVQGVNLRLDRPRLADGEGIAWNRWWQAVQDRNGQPARPATAPAREIFGASATAVLYRRRALASVARAADEVFDARLQAYYEDVDLSCRLRAAGWTARLVPRARVRHAGSVTGDRMDLRRRRWIRRNRYLVLAETLGRAFWSRLPLLLARDLLDWLRAARRGDAAERRGIASGLGCAARQLPDRLRLGPPRPSLAVFRAFRTEAA